MCWRISCSRGRTLVNDGQALVMSIGRPQMSHTFEDFTTVFFNVVHQYGLPFTRIDVVFDRYDRLSIKEGTRTNSKKGKPIHRVIETPDVPLPQDWQGFLSDPRNKADLTNFLSHELLRRAPANKCVFHCWWASWGHDGAMQHARSRYAWYYQYSWRGRYPPCASLCTYAIWRRGQVRNQSTFMWMSSSHLGNLVLNLRWH